jgi:FKBP-type peptidyl-prolyl cis-trans isomerase
LALLAMVIMTSCTAAQTDAPAAQPAPAETKAAEPAKAGAEKEASPGNAAVPAMKSPYKTDVENGSYAVGVTIARNLASTGAEIDAAALTKAINDVLGKKELALSEVELTVHMQAFSAKVQAKQQAEMAEQQKKLEEQQLRDQYLAQKNKAEAETFLEDNAKKAGILKLPNGLQYQVLKEGSGETPKATDTVTVNYVGTLADGTKFDSNDAFTTAVSGNIIRGWTQALQQMKVGSKWKLFVPPNLAYGPQRRSDLIGPNQLLVFEIELVRIEKPEGPAEKDKPADPTK